MSKRSFMLGSTGPFIYDPTLDYAGLTPTVTDYTSAGVIGFVAESATEPPKITDANSLFFTAPNIFFPNVVIEVRGSPNNDGYYLVSTVEAGTLYLHEDGELSTENGVAGVVIVGTPVQQAYRGLDTFFGSSGEDTISDHDGDTGVEVDRGRIDEDKIRGKTGGTDRITIDENGVTLEAGASVNEFSTDGALAGDSDDAVPTEKAVKLYVDTHEADTTNIHGIVDTSKLNTSDAVIVDHTLVRGDGGAQKIQDTGIIVDDSDNVSGVGTLSSGAATINGASTIGDGGSTDYMAVAADGNITLAGAARVMKGVRLFIAGTGGGASAPAFDNSFSPFDGYAYGIGDDTHHIFEIPDDCDTSEDIHIHVHWFIDRAYGDENAEINWQIVYRAVKADGTEPVDSGGQTATITSGDINIPATSKSLLHSAVGAIVAANIEQHDVIGIDLSRIALVGGANPGGAPAKKPIVTEIELHYTVDKLGEAT